MSEFTVRIELHGASYGEYATLHQRMETAGYRRYVVGTGSDGKSGYWRLPTAEYDFTSDASAHQVRDHAKLIADQVKAGAWCLVTQVAARAWETEKLQAAA